MKYRAAGLAACLAGLVLITACLPSLEPTPASNQPPVAKAGADQTVVAGVIVDLDGSKSSDPNGDDLVYQWRQIGGMAVALVNAGMDKASFHAPDVQTEIRLTFQLSVDDTNGGRAADTCIVTVQPDNVDPPLSLNVIAGKDQTVASGSTVTLQGQHAGGTGVVTYMWFQNPTTGAPPVTLSDHTVDSPTFTAPVVDQDMTITFFLMATDEDTGQDTDEVTITVKAKLTASAGEDQSVLEETVVTLTGTAGDGFGTRTASWTQKSGPAAQLADANAISTTFTAPSVAEPTTLTFELTVSDGSGATITDTVEVTVVASLTADAGGVVTVYPGAQVALQGSVVGGGGQVTYSWQQTDGESVTLTDANTATPSFSAPEGEDDKTLVFELTVTDPNSDTDVDTVTITVHAPRVRFATTMGEFVILLRPDKAPIGVQNFMRYVNEDFYQGLIMHRVIQDFMAQGGGWPPDFSQMERHDGIQIESNNGLSNVRASVAYARTSDPNSATSEFFVNLVDNTLAGAQDGNANLDYVDAQNPGYAVFGRIIEGMAVIDAMAQVATHSVQIPWNPSTTFDNVPVTAIVFNEVSVE